MNSCVDVAVKIVMGLNPYLGEENRDLLQFCSSNVKFGCTKGQLISKCLFGVFNSSKKRTKTILLEVLYYGVVVCFFEGLKIPKRRFEIN